MLEKIGLEDIGFTRDHETDKAIFWACPLGKFWRPKKPFRAHQATTLDNLERVASEVAKEINGAWVRVRILDRTDGGAARITFAAERIIVVNDRHYLEEGRDIGPLEKRAELHVPAKWLLEVDGQWIAPLKRLADKLAERKKKTSRHAYTWTPVCGEVTNGEQVLTWLKEVNFEAFQKKNDEQVAAEASRKKRQMENYNTEVNQQFNTLLINQYHDAAKDFCKTVRGKAAGMSSQSWLQLVKLALEQEGFVEWAKKWRIKSAEREAKRAAKPKPVRVPDAVMENCKVEWVDWGGTSKHRTRIENSEEGCTVNCFGSKREIMLPDGEVVIKMVGPNLKIEAAKVAQELDAAKRK